MITDFLLGIVLGACIGYELHWYMSHDDFEDGFRVGFALGRNIGHIAAAREDMDDGGDGDAD